ncbi:hypothetical protein [Enterococcus dispar]|uniref:hypothetical protein n=1 Tax=Enterococcus dispar TaxID=44009 RepID=UPI00232FEA3C|nr:hypothetical protein [Enterococcus dispar]WCG33104.1 hypothetical protein PML78_13180 [Enterococcus dispar]
MQAKELVTILATIPPQVYYTGLFLDNQPVTNLKVDAVGHFVFIAEKEQPPLSLKDTLVLLMTNKSRELYYWKNGKKQPVYGIKENGEKIIL